MRLFIRFDNQGNIVSVGKVELMHEGLKHPHGALDEGDDVLELEATAEQAALDAHELAVIYRVDVKKRKLIKQPRAATLTVNLPNRGA